MTGRLYREDSPGPSPAESRIPVSSAAREEHPKWRWDTAFCIIPGMSDAHERPMLYYVEPVHPYAGMEQFSCASKAASSSTPSRACYELGQKPHRNADSTLGLGPSRFPFFPFLSRF